MSFLSLRNPGNFLVAVHHIDWIDKSSLEVVSSCQMEESTP